MKKLPLCFWFWIEKNNENNFLIIVNGLVVQEWNAKTCEVNEIKTSSHVAWVYLRLCFYFIFILVWQKTYFQAFQTCLCLWKNFP